MLPKSLFLIWLGLFCTLQTSRSEDRVALYLVKDKLDVAHLNDLDPKGIQVTDSPLLTVSDIVKPSKSDLSFEVKKTALKRILQEIQKGPNGTVVVAVCKQGHPIYLGVLWKDVLQVSCPNLVFEVHYPLDSNTIRVRAGYPTDAFYSGKDHNISSNVFSLIAGTWKANQR
jgi:hypothetical protein